MCVCMYIVMYLHTVHIYVCFVCVFQIRLQVPYEKRQALISICGHEQRDEYQELAEQPQG